jgi:hypothetical protein
VSLKIPLASLRLRGNNMQATLFDQLSIMSLRLLSRYVFFCPVTLKWHRRTGEIEKPSRRRLARGNPLQAVDQFDGFAPLVFRRSKRNNIVS